MLFLGSSQCEYVLFFPSVYLIAIYTVIKLIKDTKTPSAGSVAGALPRFKIVSWESQVSQTQTSSTWASSFLKVTNGYQELPLWLTITSYLLRNSMTLFANAFFWWNQSRELGLGHAKGHTKPHTKSMSLLDASGGSLWDSRQETGSLRAFEVSVRIGFAVAGKVLQH